ncbi:MAG TPA: TIGR00730 family Rossman fold protein [Candidatus Saccharimonadales bacterium]|nr:TIGR00730 family Rossman fold protein [Candidatus Saccharimonadales bacterium]
MVPEDELRKIPNRVVTQQELETETAERLGRIDTEFADGFDFINRYNDTVSIFGSANSWDETNPYYQKARELAKVLSNDGYSIVTGGGPGIMEAGNRGAQEAGGHSLGLNIQLPREQYLNTYATESMSFRYFFTRKVLLAYGAMAYVYFPGGFGTFDELFEIITLIQTKKMEPAPVVLMGSEFWTGLDRFVRTYMVKELGTVSEADAELYTITDDIMVAKAVIDDYRDKHSPLALPLEQGITPLSKDDLQLT